MDKELNRAPFPSPGLFAGIALSPMAGFSDSPFRRIARRHGSAFSYSEFVPATALVRGDPEYLDMFRFHPEERPIILQIFGSDPAIVGDAAAIAEAMGADMVDLNMGCSVREIVQKGSGAALLRTPLLAAEILTRMKRSVSLPVSAKIRLGWDSASRNSVKVARLLEDAGAAMISVHGRTKAQAYQGRADWCAIADIKAAVSIPVFGSGDIGSFALAKDRMRDSGVDGILIGRAAMGNPWIFQGSSRYERSTDELIDVMRLHAEYMCDFYGDRGALLFRKHAARYLPSDGPLDAALIDLRERLMRAHSAAGLFEGLKLCLQIPAAC